MVEKALDKGRVQVQFLEEVPKLRQVSSSLLSFGGLAPKK